MWNSFYELQEHAKSFDVELKRGDTKSLSRSLKVENKIIPNRLLIQPVEGSDAQSNGAPGELTIRRYQKYAKGGAGTIWMEATALTRNLRSNESQLVLSNDTLDEFSRLVELMKNDAVKENGYAPIVIIQLSHPGRSCIVPRPAKQSEVWERVNSSNNRKTASDEEIAKLANTYGEVAKLAQKAGFDGIEVKACHRYFINELLSARNKEGRYGGSFENRTRHLNEVLAAVRANTTGVFLTIRLNHYDGIPYPEGFGMSEDKSSKPDGSEPLRLIKEIKNKYEIELINCSSNSPSFELFDDSPVEIPLFNKPVNAIKNGAQMHSFAAEIKENIEEIKVVATMFSHLKEYGADVGAGIIERDKADLIGFGRQALAYPDFVRDILQKGVMDKTKTCIYCGGCNKLLRAKKPVGCIIYDEVYKK